MLIHRHRTKQTALWRVLPHTLRDLIAVIAPCNNPKKELVIFQQLMTSLLVNGPDQSQEQLMI